MSVMIEDFSRVSPLSSQESFAMAELRHLNIPSDSDLLKSLSGMFLMKTCNETTKPNAFLESVCVGDEKHPVTLMPIELMEPGTFS